MAATNLSWAYWLDYFRLTERELADIREENGQVKGLPDFSDRNQVFFEASVNSYKEEIAHLRSVGSQQFELITTYPGLLFGTGYQHEIGADGEVKLGLFFDYTTGWPVIPGASVKGVLRASFYTADAAQSEANRAFLQVLINNMEEPSQALGRVFEDASLFKLFTNRVFGPATRDKEGRKAENNLPLYERDIFHDAIIVRSDHPYIDTDRGGAGQIFGRDFVTPHKNPFQDPVPIQFMKVLPNVHVLFQFDLKDTVLPVGEGVSITIKAADKLALFKAIILHMGVGAKTNVGYGQFVEPPEPIEFEEGQELEAKFVHIRSDNRAEFVIEGEKIESQPLGGKDRKKLEGKEGKIVRIRIGRVDEESGKVRSIKILDDK